MSCANITPAPVREGQEAFDRLVAAAGLTDAPADLQLSALRSMSPLEIHDQIASRRSLIIEDEEFFVDWTGQGRRFEELSPMPSWTKAVVAGHTKDEMALFAQKWATMSAEALYQAWEAVYPDPAYANDVLSAYGVTKSSSQSDLVAALIAYTGDGVFGKVTYSIATAHLQEPAHAPAHPANPKVYLYSFDQPDVLSRNPIFHGSAYHSQDNAFLFYYPQVAGPAAPAEFRAAADAFASAALKLINGKEPWEDISVARRFMSIHADRSGVKDDEQGTSRRWASLVDTDERLDMFMLGKALLYEAMEYALSLPLDVHRQ
jgi:carboxylesterase type B